MKIRIRIRDDGRVFATAMVPSGRKFIPVTTVAHVPDDVRASTESAVNAVYQEVMSARLSKRNGASEAGSKSK